MKNIYPSERTLFCKEGIEIKVSSKLKEEGLEESIPFLQKLMERSRLLVNLTVAEEGERIFFDVLVEDMIFSIGYYYNTNQYFLTKIKENKKKAYVEFLRKGILVYFSQIMVKDIASPSTKDKVLVEKVKKITLSQLPETLIEYSNRKEEKQEVKSESDEPEIKENLEKLLDFATIYNKYEKEKGKQQCQKVPLNYTKIETQAEYENTYIFYVGNAKEYQKTMYVKITDVEQEENDINGQILEIEPISEYQNKLYIQLSEQVDFKKIPQNGKIHCVYQDVQNRVREKVIENIRKGKTPAKYLYHTFENFDYLPFENIDFSKLEEKMQKEKYPLNPSQVKAVEKGIATQDLSLILGPPGTGKTTVIAWWVKYFLKQNKRILISSQNNSAVDNVLERIGKEYTDIIRIGDEKKVAENIKQFLYTNKLAEFKKKLVNTTEKSIQDNQQKLEQKIQKNESYQEIDQIQRKVQEQQEKIKENQKILKQEIKNSKTYYDDVLKLQKKSRILEEKISVVSNQSNKILKFFVKILHKWEILQYQRIQDWLARKRKKYNEAKQTIQSMITDDDFLEEIKKLRECQEKLKSVPKEERENLDQKMNQIQQEIKKFRKIVEALSDWREHIKERNDILTAILLETIQVVGATCIGIQSRKLFADTTFDVAIVDEAGQIQIHNVMVPISRAKKSILLRRS